MSKAKKTVTATATATATAKIAEMFQIAKEAKSSALVADTKKATIPAMVRELRESGCQYADIMKAYREQAEELKNRDKNSLGKIAKETKFATANVAKAITGTLVTEMIPDCPWNAGKAGILFNRALKDKGIKSWTKRPVSSLTQFVKEVTPLLKDTVLIGYEKLAECAGCIEKQAIIDALNKDISSLKQKISALENKLAKKSKTA